MFACWEPDGSTGLLSGYRRNGPVGPHWYWAALVTAGGPLLHVAEWHVPPRADPFLVKAPGLWAEHTIDAPMQQWTVANETYAIALEDPDRRPRPRLRRADRRRVRPRVVRHRAGVAPPRRLRPGRCRARTRRAPRWAVAAGGGAGPTVAPLGRRARAGRSRPRPSPTPGGERRSRSPTAASPTGSSPLMAGDGFLALRILLPPARLTGGCSRRTRRSTSQATRPTPGDQQEERHRRREDEGDGEQRAGERAATRRPARRRWSCRRRRRRRSSPRLAGVAVMSIVSVDMATRACTLACIARSCSSAVSRFVSSPSMRTIASTSVAVAYSSRMRATLARWF